MTPQEQALITGLFERLKAADSAAKDREAAALIDRLVVAQPTAPYLLAQTVLVQQHALDNAEARIRELEQTAAQAPAPSFLGGLFGRRAAESPQAAAPRPVAPAYAPQPVAGSVPITAPASGGFLQSALTTAAGVAGGALLYDGIRSLFFHNPGPFGGYGGAWGQAGGLTETNVVNNYYEGSGTRDSGNAADTASTLDQGGSGDLQNASYDSASNDQGYDGGGFDTAGDFDSGDSGGSDLA